MSTLTTFFAVMKGYTTINIFTLPIGFKYGGWLFSPCLLVLACFFETTTAVKLTEAAHLVRIYSYPDLVEYCFGKGVRYVFQVLVAFLHFQFSLTMLAFFVKDLKQLTKTFTGEDVEIWVFMVITIVIFAPIVWIRTVERFRIGYLYSSAVIVGFVICIITLMSIHINENDD